MQDTIPYIDLHVFKLHDIKRILFLVIPTCQKGKMWIEFFLDPSSWWDHILTRKVNEHQTSQSSHVNGAIAFVEVNLIALSLLLSYPS